MVNPANHGMAGDETQGLTGQAHGFKVRRDDPQDFRAISRRWRTAHTLRIMPWVRLRGAPVVAPQKVRGEGTVGRKREVALSRGKIFLSGSQLTYP